MSVSRAALVMAAVLAAIAPFSVFAVPPRSTPQPLVNGIWISPHNNVKVATVECGEKLCGWVVWATPEAEQDARDGGVDRLVGTELLRDYHQTDANRWQGHVFVPDLGRTFYSTITLLDPAAVKISGCILGGMVCKSQVWRKV